MSTKTSKKLSKSSTGSPAQYSQSSRKGKKAWRKNIDIGGIEETMEELRAEERETGSTLQNKKNEELFEIDDKGDDNVRTHFPKFDMSKLSYTRSLSQRSAVPAILSRSSASSTSNSNSKRTAASLKLTHADKSRLLRIGKRRRFGPFDSVIDPTASPGDGSALLEPSHAVRASGAYDIWSSSSSKERKDGNSDKPKKTAVTEDTETDTNKDKNAGDDDVDIADLTKAENAVRTRTPQNILRARIALPAVVLPSAGISYNPPASAHAELLAQAAEEAARAEAAQLREREAKAKLVEARREATANEIEGSVVGVPAGMVVDVPGEGDDDKDIGKEEDTAGAPPRSAPPRKTKAQRQRAERAKLEKRLALQKRQLAHSLASASSQLSKRARKQLKREREARAAALAEKRGALAKKLATEGLAGKKVGKHVVRKERTEVQLGEDLSESLRGLKVEGNLFKDRFLSLQHRALLEPRVPVVPRRHKPKTKEVEKFAWKHFE